MRTIMPAFDRFADEGKIIGRLVTGYGELEFDLAWCLRWIIDDMDTAFKVVYRAGGEVSRVNLGDALGRQKLPTQALRTKFEQAISGMHACRRMRNQYAHCSFGDEPTKLFFVHPNEAADEHIPVSLTELRKRYVDLELLQQQEAYFCWVSDLFTYINFQMQVRRGAIKSNPMPNPPKPMRPPAMHK